MKRNKKAKSRRRRFYQAVKGGPFRLRKKPQPAAPHPFGNSAAGNGAAAHPAGVLRFNSDEFHLPEALAEAGETESNGLMPGRVVLIITVLALAFISIMAWFVSRMPNK